MTKKIFLILVLFTAPSTQAINFTDNAVVKTAQTFLEQPGATWTDTAVFIACSSLANILRNAYVSQHSMTVNSKTNIFLRQLSYPFLVGTPWLIRGFPTYKWCAPFVIPTGCALQHQDKNVILMLIILPLAGGYAGLLAKNIITACIKK